MRLCDYEAMWLLCVLMFPVSCQATNEKLPEYMYRDGLTRSGACRRVVVQTCAAHYEIQENHENKYFSMHFAVPSFLMVLKGFVVPPIRLYAKVVQLSQASNNLIFQMCLHFSVITHLQSLLVCQHAFLYGRWIEPNIGVHGFRQN